MTQQIPPDITAPVQAQLAAYNARDIDAFVACYATGIRLFRFHGESYCEGRAALRARYAPLFELNPALHAQILHRTVVPPYVADHERVTGLTDREPIEALVIYEVRDGLIQAVRFIQKGG